MKNKNVPVQKTVSAKKLPSLLKKSYQLQKFEKKVLKKIYIADDKKFVQSFFQKDVSKKDNICIPKDLQLAKKDFARLKLIAKEIKKQKFGIKLVPLAAVVGAIVALCLVVATFKNIIVKKGLVAGMQAAFQAKTDIAYLDLDIFGAKLQIKDLQQANKNDVWKNIFEISEITFDFNLTELLRGKFYIENITVADILIGTDRKTSGYIPPKQSSEEKKNQSFISEMQVKLVSDVQKTLVDTFSEYNPETIINNVQNNLKSPAMAMSVKATVEDTIKKWQNTPSEMEQSIKGFTTSVNDLVNTDWANVKDVAKLNDALTKINNVANEGKSIKEKTDKIVVDFKSDVETAKQVSKDIVSAIESDKSLIDKEIDKFRTLKAEGVGGIFNKMMSAFMYNLFGKYYPYVQKGLDTAIKVKSSIPASKSEKPKPEKKVDRRMKGRDVYYKRDRVPKFLLEKAYSSGANWLVSAKEISSDPDKRGAPAELLTKFSVNKINNEINAVVDGRSNTSNPLLAIDYDGSGFPIALNIENNFALNSTYSVISCGVSGSANGSFDIRGSINMSDMKIETPSFEPRAIYTVYKKAIDKFTSLKFGFDIGYDVNDGMFLSIDTDIATQFANIFQELLISELTSITASARQKVEEILAEKTGGVSEKIIELVSIEDGISFQQKSLDDSNKKLEEVKAKITAQINAKVNEKTNEVKEQVKNEAEKKATETLKGLFGR